MQQRSNLNCNRFSSIFSRLVHARESMRLENRQLKKKFTFGWIVYSIRSLGGSFIKYVEGLQVWHFFKAPWPPLILTSRFLFYFQINQFCVKKLVITHSYRAPPPAFFKKPTLFLDRPIASAVKKAQAKGFE